jgi:integral membrane protein
MSTPAAPSLAWFRWLARAEGISVLVLFGIAMPMKYGFADPSFVPLAGRVHGFLFLAFLAGLAAAHTQTGWGVRRSAGWFLASLVPGGTFWAERRWLAP